MTPGSRSLLEIACFSPEALALRIGFSYTRTPEGGDTRLEESPYLLP